METWLEPSVVGSFREVPSIALTSAINRTWRRQHYQTEGTKTLKVMFKGAFYVLAGTSCAHFSSYLLSASSVTTPSVTRPHRRRRTGSRRVRRRFPLCADSPIHSRVLSDEQALISTLLHRHCGFYAATHSSAKFDSRSQQTQRNRIAEVLRQFHSVIR